MAASGCPLAGIFLAVVGLLTFGLIRRGAGAARRAGRTTT